MRSVFTRRAWDWSGCKGGAEFVENANQRRAAAKGSKTRVGSREDLKLSCQVRLRVLFLFLPGGEEEDNVCD